MIRVIDLEHSEVIYSYMYLIILIKFECLSNSLVDVMKFPTFAISDFILYFTILF